MRPQPLVEKGKDFEHYFFAKRLTSIEEQKNEYDIPGSDYLEETCTFTNLENRGDTTPQTVSLGSLCTAFLKSPETKNSLEDFYLDSIKDKKISGDNEINEDQFEVQLISKVEDKNKQPLLDKLSQVYQECAEENWDGYDARQISIETYLEAIKLIRLLPSHIKEPEIIPEPTGDIALEWYLGKNFIFVISVGGNNVITYAGLFGGTSKTHGTEFFGNKLPKTIIENIQRLFER
ncbi:MAG: hypothetical protein R6W88_10795 [Desulfobacterales bacterium]